MSYQQKNLQIFFYFAAAILILGGCQLQIQKPICTCPGGRTTNDPLSLLENQLANAVPLKASGQCILQYYLDGKPHRENFPVKLWANPPDEIYLQGDVAFDAKGIVFGSNKNEFWWSVKAQVNSYYWGSWAEQDCFGEIKITPRIVIEALGMVEVGDKENWFLLREGNFDVLTKSIENVKSKKIYIWRHNCLVKKIAYLDVSGETAAIAELDKYKEVSKGCFIPAVIEIVTCAGDDAKEQMSISLKLESIKSANFTDEQKRQLFQRREPKGFEHVYKISGGEVVEQPK